MGFACLSFKNKAVLRPVLISGAAVFSYKNKKPYHKTDTVSGGRYKYYFGFKTPRHLCLTAKKKQSPRKTGKTIPMIFAIDFAGRAGASAPG